MKELKEKLILQEDEEVDSLTIAGDEELPEIESQEAVTIEEPTQEDKENGMYSMISQEMRDTLQDIENLKSIITTIKSIDETRESVIASLESMIDERTIHVGMLQAMLEEFGDGTKELIDQGNTSIEEQPKEEETIIDSNIDKIV